MTYERLEEIKQIILNIYTTLKISDFPIDLNYILDSYGIHVYTYSFSGRELCLKYSEDSFSFGSKIFYDETMYYKRIRFSIAHELGHIMLNHTRLEENKSFEEEEADRFAASLIVPLVAVSRFNYITLESLMDHFNISRRAANIAYGEYKHNYRGYNSFSECDKKLYDYLFNDTYGQPRRYVNKSGYNKYMLDSSFLAAENNWLYGDDY